MKIVIGGEEVCGLIKTYADEFRKQGHTVTTSSTDLHRFFDIEYDLDTYNLAATYWLPKSIIKTPVGRLISKCIRGIDVLTLRALRWMTIKKIVAENDVYIFIWRGLDPDNKDLRLWHESGKKVISLLLGSEVRDYATFVKQWDMGAWDFPDHTYAGFEQKIKRLRLVERYSNSIYSVPDQDGLALKPYYHNQLPIDISAFTYNVPGRKVPIIVHAPSAPHIKGSDVVDATMEKLAADGFEFDYRRISGMKHADLLQLLTEADIVVDELILFGPAVLALEAMSSGCAVATNTHDFHRPFFDAPVIPTDRHTIYESVKKLIVDVDFRTERAKASRVFVETNNNAEKITRFLLKNVDSTEEFHYHPTYYENHFKPRNKKEAEVAAKYDNLVKSQLDD